MVLFNGQEANSGILLAKFKQQIKTARTNSIGNSNLASMAKTTSPALVGEAQTFSHLAGLVALKTTPSAKSKATAQSTSAPGPRDATLEIKRQIQELMDTGLYEFVEPDYRVKLLAMPLDAAFSDGRLWGLRNTGQNRGTSGSDIEVVSAWDQTTGSSDVVVAVIDSGIRYTHQDLAANMWRNSGEIPGNSLDDDRNGYVDDVFGINAITGSGNPMDDNDHGTHCAGTIGAQANGGGPQVGVAWNVRLMGLKFLGADGGGNTSDAIECINYAVSKGAKILNNSWGGGAYSSALYNAINSARAQGVLFVAAAGNESNNNDRFASYPASYNLSNVIAVAAVDRRDQLASFSNYGATTVHIAAPGVEIYSSTATSDFSYESWPGTSMAAPHVSGVAALLVSRFPGISLADLRSRLLGSVRPVAGLAGKVSTAGVVSASRAMGATGANITASLSTRPATLRAGSPGTLIVALTRLGSALPGALVGGTVAGQTLQFRDDGAAPDATSGDGFYSATLSPLAQNSYNLTLSVSHPSAGTLGTNLGFVVAAATTGNDDFENAESISTGTSRLTANSYSATSQEGEPSSSNGGLAMKTLWWRWTAPRSGSTTFTTFDSNFDTTLAVFQGSTLSSLIRTAENDDSSGVLQSSVTFNAISGQTYYIQVDGYGGDSGNIALNLPASASVPIAPAFTRNPSDQVVQLGATVSISAAASGNPTPSIAWFKDGQPIFNGGRFSGANASTLVISPVQSADGGFYHCRATNSIGSAESLLASITVGSAWVAPANDNFSNRESIGAGVEISGTNLHSTREANEPVHAGVGSGRTVWYAWNAPSGGNQLASIDLAGSSFDTIVAVYRGGALGALFPVASNNDNGNSRQSRVEFVAQSGTEYVIVVDGVGGDAGALNLRLDSAPLQGGGSSFPAQDIPRAINDYRTITSSIIVSGQSDSFPINSILLNMNISHTYRGDIYVTLQSPQGHVLTLSNREGSSADNLIYSNQGISQFSGFIPVNINPNGTWILTIMDQVGGDSGTLNSWSLNFTGGSNTNYLLFESSDTPEFIYDNWLVESYINVSGQVSSLSISSILFDLLINHEYMRDLIVELVSPQRHTITISYRSGTSTILEINGQPLAGFTSNLPAFINPNGRWTLKVLDVSNEDYGMLQSWALAFPDPFTVQLSLGGGLYVTADGGIHYSTQVEQVGQVLKWGAVRLRDSRGTPLGASSFAAAYDISHAEGSEIGIWNVGNTLRVALPNFSTPRRGGRRVFSSTSVMDFNLSNGRMSSTRTVTGSAETIALELFYNADLNSDGVRGEIVAISLGGGLCVGSAGGLYWSAFSRDSGQTVALDSIQLRDSIGSPLSASTFQADYNAALARGAQVSVVSQGLRLVVILPKFIVPRGGRQAVFSSVQLHVINLASGRLESSRVISDLRTILALESQYSSNFNADGVVGDVASIDLGGNLYATSSGAVYYSPTGESVGSMVSGASAVMLKDAGGNALTASGFLTAHADSGGRIGVVEETDSQTGVSILKIGLPQYAVPRRSTMKVLSSVAIYTVNPATGVGGAPMVVRGLMAVLAEESRFQKDFNADGVVGDVASIDLGGNLYATSSGAVYYSPTGESVGSVVSGASAVMLKDAGGNALAASGFLTAHADSGGRIGSRSLGRTHSFRPSNRMPKNSAAFEEST
jgi:subtilisin family serine protease/subtilisin-like proprotein convertase family protein